MGKGTNKNILYAGESLTAGDIQKLISGAINAGMDRVLLKDISLRQYKELRFWGYKLRKVEKDSSDYFLFL